MTRNYHLEDLRVWVCSRNLRKNISKLTRKLPKNEQYRLPDQMIRAARSVSANIAEGHGRYHYQENIQFTRIARGSLYELIDHTFVCLDEDYISNAELKILQEDIYSLIKQINSYINHLKNKRKTI